MLHAPSINLETTDAVRFAMIPVEGIIAVPDKHKRF